MTALLAPRNPNREVCDPTGIAAWPRILLAGPEKTGKTYEALKTSLSDMIGQTFFVEIGEDSGDEYARVGRYRMVKHDGTYLDILDTFRWCVAQPRDASGRPNLIVVDSASLLWELVCDEQTAAARQKAEKRGWTNFSDQDLTITSEMWNRAKDRWKDVIGTLRHHDGPVIYCARLEEVVVFDGDRPTKARMWKVKAEKNLPFDVTAVVQLRSRGSAWLTGVRSLNVELASMQTKEFPNFSVDTLLRQLGMEQRVISSYVAPRPDAYLGELDAERQQGGQQQGRGQQGRPQQQAYQDLPTGQALLNVIKQAFKTGDPNKLVELRTRYGILYLERQMVQGKDGLVTALDAIANSVNALNQRQGQGQAPGVSQGNTPGQQGEPSGGVPQGNAPGQQAATPAPEGAKPPPECNATACTTQHDRVHYFPNGHRCHQHSPEAEANARRAAEAAEADQKPTGTDRRDELSSGRDVDAIYEHVLPGEDENADGWNEYEPPAGEHLDEGQGAGEEDSDPWASKPVGAPARQAAPAPAAQPVSGADAVLAILRREAEAQAGILGVTLDKHLDELVPPGGRLDDLTASRLRKYVVDSRVKVCQALQGKGRAQFATAYLGLGKRVTADGPRILEELPEEYGG